MDGNPPPTWWWGTMIVADATIHPLYIYMYTINMSDPSQARGTCNKKKAVFLYIRDFSSPKLKFVMSAHPPLKGNPKGSHFSTPDAGRQAGRNTEKQCTHHTPAHENHRLYTRKPSFINTINSALLPSVHVSIYLLLLLLCYRILKQNSGRPVVLKKKKKSVYSTAVAHIGVYLVAPQTAVLVVHTEWRWATTTVNSSSNNNNNNNNNKHHQQQNNKQQQQQQNNEQQQQQQENNNNNNKLQQPPPTQTTTTTTNTATTTTTATTYIVNAHRLSLSPHKLSYIT